MRPIKFRQPIFVGSDFRSFHYWGFINGDYHAPLGYLGYIEKASVQSQQFTGLLDRNGKEIYEGDILYHKYWSKPELSFDGLWFEEKIEVKIPDFFMYLGSDVVQNSPEKTDEFVSHMEIVGNVYENPGLLTENGGSNG